jgi:ubiquinone biosynthesis accessory factor UbiJ
MAVAAGWWQACKPFSKQSLFDGDNRGTMATSFPFFLLEQSARAVQSFLLNAPLPVWLTDEAVNRVLLLINHVLAQEPVALERLSRQKGQVIALQWLGKEWAVVPTAAGLLERADPTLQTPALRIQLDESMPLALLQGLAQGHKPPVHIHGDVQLAAEINWLIDNVRWDLEEDLARLWGDAPAHSAMALARSVWVQLKRWLPSASSAASSVTPNPS